MYEAMLPGKSVSLLSPLELSARDHDDVTPSLVVNIFLSILLCGFAVFWATRWWNSAPARVAVSFAAALLVGVAEVGVYMGYLRRVKISREREARTQRKERRRLVEGNEWRTDVKKVRSPGVLGAEVRRRR